MYSARWPNGRTFLCAGRAGFPEILQILSRVCCATFASSRHWTEDSRIILRQSACRLGQELRRNSEVHATTRAELTQVLRARRAEIFRGLCNNFFRASWEKILRDPDAGRILVRI